MNTPASKALVLSIRTPQNNANPTEAVIEEEGGTLGRAPANTVPLPGDQNIALVHATIEPIGERWILKDIGDLIPVMRNGRPLGFGQKCEIGEGDELDIGIFQLTVSLDQNRAARLLAQRTQTITPHQAPPQPFAAPSPAPAPFAAPLATPFAPAAPLIPSEPQPVATPAPFIPPVQTAFAIPSPSVATPDPFDDPFSNPFAPAPVAEPVKATLFDAAPTPAPAPPRVQPQMHAPSPQSDDLLSLLADPFSGAAQQNARNFTGDDDQLLAGVLPDEPNRERSDLTNPMHMQANLDPLRHREESIDSLFGLGTDTSADPLAGGLLGGATQSEFSNPLSDEDPILSLLNDQLGHSAGQTTQREGRTDLNTSINLPTIKSDR